MYWPGQNIHRGGLLNTGGNKLEQTNIDDLDGETLEKIIGNGPLDLSGFGEKNQKRDVESPLDLSVKTRKRHADSTEQRDMYNTHAINYPALKRSNSGVEMDRHIGLATETRVINNDFDVNYGSRQRKISYNANRSAEIYPVGIQYNSKAFTKDQSVIKHNESTGWPAPHVTQSVELTRQQEMYPAVQPSDYQFINAKSVRKNTDEQYYAMIQAIQKQNKVAKLEKIEQKRKLISDQCRQNPAYYPPAHPQGNIINKNFQMVTNSGFCPERQHSVQQSVRTSDVSTSNYGYNTQSSQLGWSPAFIEYTQRCSPDSTNNPIQSVQSAQRNRVQIHPGTSVHNNTPTASVISHSGSKFCVNQRHPQSRNELALAKSQEYRKLQYREQSNSSVYTSDSMHALPKQEYHQPTRTFVGAPQSKNARSYHSHFTPVPSPLASPRTTHSNQLSRSIVRGTSGLYHEQSGDCIQTGHSPVETGRRTCDKISTDSLNDQNCVRSCDGHEIAISSTCNDSSLTNFKQHHNKVYTTISAIPNRQGSSFTNGKTGNVVESKEKWQTPDIKACLPLKDKPKVYTEKKAYETSSGGQPDNKTHTTESSDGRYSSPLLITIPIGGDAATKQCPKSDIKEKPVETKPKPFSRKHIIMNAVQKDEGLKGIVNSVEKPKTVIHSSSDVKTSNLRSQNSSPVCPESPKMPTLSPQQRLPPPPLVSPLIGEPPKLDIAAGQRNDASLKTSPQRIYYQGSRPRLLSSLPRKTQSIIDDEEEDDDDHDMMVTHESTVFRPFVHYKKIPIANVAPMVHKSISSENTSPNTSNDQVVKKRKMVEVKPQMSEKVSDDFKSSSPKLESPLMTEKMMISDKDSTKTTEIDTILNSSAIDSAVSEKKKMKLAENDNRTDSPILDTEIKTETIEIESYEDRNTKIRRQKHPFILQKIASSAGFVSDSKMKKTSDNLFDDPNLLGREGRALRRAIIQFKRMEKKDEQTSPRHLKLSKAQTKAGEISRKARQRRLRRNRDIKEKQSQYIKRRGEHNKSKYKGFIDFKPEVLVSRTRTQAAGMRGLVKYNRNAAYENELNKDETRKAMKHRTRLRHDTGKISSDLKENCPTELEDIENTEKFVIDTNVITDDVEKIASASEDCKVAGDIQICSSTATVTGASESVGSNVTEGTDKPENGGTWEIGGTSTSLKQTLRNGKSKGGIMMKLLFRPKQKRRFRRRSSTQRIGKYRRRPRFRGRKNIAGNLKGECSRSKNNSLPELLGDDDVFVNDMGQTSENDSITLANSEDILHSDLFAYQNVAAAPEVKKLSVYKDTGETMLHRAARLGHLDVIITCLQTGNIDVNTKDNAGYTPLHESCVSGHMDIARILIRYGANVNCASQDGIRPIHDAVENDHIEIVRLLVVYGADPTIATYGGLTPIKIAHSDLMYGLLSGCIGDINGFTEDEKETVWEFDFSSTSGRQLPDTDIFIDIPDDPIDENWKGYVMESSFPCFQIYKPAKQNSKEKSVSYTIMADVCEYYKVHTSDIEEVLCFPTKTVSKYDLISDKSNQIAFERVSLMPDGPCSILEVHDLHEIHKTFTNRSLCKTKEKSKVLPSKRKSETQLEKINYTKRLQDTPESKTKKTKRKLVFHDDSCKNTFYHKKNSSGDEFSRAKRYEADSNLVESCVNPGINNGGISDSETDSDR